MRYIEIVPTKQTPQVLHWLHPSQSKISGINRNLRSGGNFQEGFRISDKLANSQCRQHVGRNNCAKSFLNK